ncbi:hypothetical protein [Streptosporangium saharense]|uniref:Uncharacterized protein (DUF2267 family) n=1 Tax=Streptosporangium saharense TaxID=1706840 RepID=A0A7W7QI38_9ACTN|nr:hypothetical protein [Streptosporangium saharense]MBB4913982.1 uncharacterized protein (DUF2267 family) [Streptosporangium saharense]
MHLGDLAASRSSVAFPVYHALISPTLRDLIRGPLRRARHGGRPCTGVSGTHWCDECEQETDDRLLDGYVPLRRTLAGDPPRTRTGEPVRELETVARWVTSPEAARQDVHRVARLIRDRPRGEEPAAIRAARAQLVHYPLRSLEARVRRDIATARGASAKPSRDLRETAWAAPLREDPVAFALLTDAVVRLRGVTCDLYAVPTTLLDEHGLEARTARKLLRATLERLRELRPAFYTANVAVHLGMPLLPCDHPPTPEEVVIRGEEERQARTILAMLLNDGRSRYRSLVEGVRAAVPESGPELVARAAHDLGITPVAAERFVRTLARLISRANLP